jgi:hypothetical protein
LNKHTWELAWHLVPSAKKTFDKYQKENNIHIWSLLVFAAGHWDKLIGTKQRKMSLSHI